jgi:hypothetical protein
MWLIGEMFRNSLEKTSQKRQKVVKIIHMKLFVSDFRKVSKAKGFKEMFLCMASEQSPLAEGKLIFLFKAFYL